MDQKNTQYKNSFVFLRLLFASRIIFAHSFALLDPATDNPLQAFARGIFMTGIGVPGFFILSGFLVYHSLIKSESLSLFFKKRITRLLPGLITVVLFCVFVLGPVFTNNSIQDYFLSGKTYSYLIRTMLFIPTDNLLPGVFQENPTPYINGSLWTLRYELLCYLSCIPIHFLRKSSLKKYYLWSIAIVCWGVQALLISGVAEHYLSPGIVYHLHNMTFLVGFFYSGALLAFYKKSWMNYKGILVGCSIVAIITFYILPGTAFDFLLLLALPVLIISFGSMYIKALQLPASLSNISYGIYLYAFPLQQTLVALGIKDPYVLFAIALPLSWLFGFVSYHLVEKRFLITKKATKPI